MKIKKIIFVLFLMMVSLKLMAATFLPLSFEEMVTQSSGGAEVILASKRAFQTPHGIIQTEHVFEVIDSYNLEKNDLEGNYLVLTMMGGSLNGLTTHIDGAPEFKVGEKSFLLLKKIHGKMYLSNFTLGKFEIKEIDGETFYQSVVFPQSEEVGKIKKNKMIELIAQKNTVSRNPYPDLKNEEADKSKKTATGPDQSKIRHPASADMKSSTSFHLMSIFLLSWLCVMCYSFYKSMGNAKS